MTGRIWLNSSCAFDLHELNNIDNGKSTSLGGKNQEPWIKAPCLVFRWKFGKLEGNLANFVHGNV